MICDTCFPVLSLSWSSGVGDAAGGIPGGPAGQERPDDGGRGQLMAGPRHDITVTDLLEARSVQGRRETPDERRRAVDNLSDLWLM